MSIVINSLTSVAFDLPRRKKENSESSFNNSFQQDILSIQNLPLSLQAGLASKAIATAWNLNEVFQERVHVKTTIQQCYYSQKEFFCFKDRLPLALLGATLGKLSATYVRQGRRVSKNLAIKKILLQRMSLEMRGNHHFGVVTWLTTTSQNPDKFLIIQTNSPSQKKSFYFITSKMQGVRSLTWESDNSYEEKIVRSLFLTIKFTTLSYASSFFFQERAIKRIQSIERFSALFVSIKPGTKNPLVVEVNIGVKKFLSPTSRLEENYIKKITEWIGEIEKVMVLGIQFLMIDNGRKLKEICLFETYPETILTHCRINALGLAAKIAGPYTLLSLLKKPQISKFNALCDIFMRTERVIKEALKKDRGFLYLFNLNHVTLRKGKSEQIYGTHMFLVVQYPEIKKEIHNVGYDFFSSYIGKNRIQRNGKNYAFTKNSSLRFKAFKSAFLNPLETILTSHSWTMDVEQAYGKLFNVCHLAFLNHKFYDRNQKPLSTIPFNVTVIPFDKQKSKREFRIWNVSFPEIPLKLVPETVFDKNYASDIPYISYKNPETNFMISKSVLPGAVL